MTDSNGERPVEQCQKLGRMLGLDEPVAEAVWRAAVMSETYARHLLVCRRDPEMLQHLLDHPPAPRKTVSTSELLMRGTKALMSWAKTGFAVVDESTYQARLEACERCPELNRLPSDQGSLTTFAALGLSNKATCNLCGCVVARKARLSSESCPSLDPNSPHLTRWQEPVPQEALDQPPPTP